MKALGVEWRGSVERCGRSGALLGPLGGHGASGARRHPGRHRCAVVIAGVSVHRRCPWLAAASRGSELNRLPHGEEFVPRAMRVCKGQFSAPFATVVGRVWELVNLKSANSNIGHRECIALQRRRAQWETTHTPLWRESIFLLSARIVLEEFSTTLGSDPSRRAERRSGRRGPATSTTPRGPMGGGGASTQPRDPSKRCTGCPRESAGSSVFLFESA
jgi:hypothetical protein